MNIVFNILYLAPCRRAMVEMYMDVTLHFCVLFSMIIDKPNKGELTSLNSFSKAIEKAADNQKVVEAIGVPLVRGPWYEASLEVGHRRRSVSCTFPVSGPHGSGFFQIEATRNGGWCSILSLLCLISCAPDTTR